MFSGWGAQVLSLAMGLVTLPMFFRYLPQTELGVWMFFMGTSVFVNLADFGFSPVLGRHLAFELGKGDREASSNYAGSSYYYSLSCYISRVSAPVLLVFMIFLGGIFIWSLEVPEALKERSLVSWGVFSLSQAVTCRWRFLQTTLNGHGEVGYQNIIEVIAQGLSLACYFVVMHFFNGGILGLTFVVLGRSMVISTLLQLTVRNRVPQTFRGKVKVSWPDVKPHIRPAADLFLISIGTFLILNTDQYFIVQFLGAEKLPDYAAAYRMVQVAYIFASTAAGMSIPYIARMSAAGDQRGLHRLLMINTTVGMMLQMAAVSLIGVYGDHLIQFWLGKGHFVGWNIIWVFCVMLTLENHHVIFASFGLNAKTDPTWGKMSIAAGVLNLILTFAGVKLLGLLGVALATMIAQMLTNNWYAVVKTLSIIRLSFWEYVRRSGAFWFAASIVLIFLLYGIRFAISDAVASLVAAVCATSVFSVGVMFIYFKQSPKLDL